MKTFYSGGSEVLDSYKSPVDKRVHRYFQTLLLKLRRTQETSKLMLLRLNLTNKLNHHRKKRRVTKSYIYECKTYAVNTAKWKAAQEWCADRKIEFKIITEKELGIR